MFLVFFFICFRVATIDASVGTYPLKFIKYLEITRVSGFDIH